MKKIGFILVISAGLLWGSSCLFIHYLSGFGFTPAQMTAARGLVAFLAVAGLTLIRDRSAMKVTKKEFFLFLAGGFCMFATAYTYYAAVTMTSPSTAAVLMYMEPIYVAIFSGFFFKESFTPLKILSSATVLVGCCLVSGMVGGLRFEPLGVILAILSGVFYAVYSILMKFAMRKNAKPLSAAFYCDLFMALFALIPAKIHLMPALIAADPVKTLPALAGLGLVTFFVPYYLYTLSLRYIPAGTASALAVIEPLAATIYSILFLKEKLTLLAGVGIVLILGASILLCSLKEKQKVSDDGKRTQT